MAWLALAVGAFLLAATLLPRAQSLAGPPETPVEELTHIHGLAVDPRDSSVLWIATHHGLFRMTNARRLVRVGRSVFDLMGFVAHPRDQGVFYASGHPAPGERRLNPIGVEASRDGGQTWQPLALAGQVDFHAMAISPADPKVLYGWNVVGNGEFYRSRDGGKTWENLGRRDLDRVFYLAAHPREPGTVFAAMMKGIYRSEDAGGTWRLHSPALFGVAVTAVEWHPRQPERAYGYAATPQWGMVRSSDGGRSWQSLGRFLGERNAGSRIALDPRDANVLYYATYSDDLVRSRDAGKTWEQWLAGGRVQKP